jgi:hypothetical protein
MSSKEISLRIRISKADHDRLISVAQKRGLGTSSVAREGILHHLASLENWLKRFEGEQQIKTLPTKAKPPAA